MLERKQFTFYVSFANAVLRIKDDSSRAQAYDAIVKYAIWGELPDLNSMSESAAIAFDLIRPNLDSSRKKAEAGESGGKQNKSKTKTKRKQNKSKEKASNNREEQASEKEKEKEKEIESECSISPLPPFPDYPVLQDAFDGWLRYKKERKEKYTDEGMRRLIRKLTASVKEYGEDAVSSVINDSMASGYQGIVFDRLKRTKKQQTDHWDFMDL